MEQVREYFVEVRIYKDTNKATRDEVKRFNEINDAIEYLIEVKGK